MAFFWRWTWLGLICLALPGAWGQTLTLHEAAFTLAPTPELPATQAHWQPQSLPDRWRDTRPEADGAGWYKLEFEKSALGSGLQAVLIPHASVNAAVYLNGALLGSGGQFSEPMARTWNRPRMYMVPPETLRPGTNTMLLYLQAHPYTQASLYPPQMGPEGDIRALYEQAYFLRVTLNQIASILIATVGLLMLNMWWRRRQDTAYGYFALSALVWAMQSTNLYVLNPPIPTAAWEILVNASFQIFSGLLLISMLSYVRADWAPLKTWLWATVLISAPAMAIAGPKDFLQVTAVLHMATLAGAVGSLVLLFRSALQGRNPDARLLLASMGLIVLFAAHDWLLHSKHLWFTNDLPWLPLELYLLQYSAPVVFLAIGWIMTARFGRVLNDFEALSVELDHRIQTKHAQLEESFERLRVLERERAVQDERERIHSDLHDDVGAKLLSLVYRAGSPEAADLARSALQDLRDVVSRSGTGSFGLEDVLADIRSECEQRLSAARIALAWDQADDLPTATLSQPAALHLGRIVREALSNVIRHAGAQSVHIRIRRSGEGMDMDIADNGRGFPAASQAQGRGLRNMQTRAQWLGAQLRHQAPVGGGCSVALHIPTLQGI